jgi:predicted nucleic acid-binding protein
MAVLVVDASIALAWALPDESSAYADAVLAAVENGPMVVPSLWPHEIANGIAVAYMRRRITLADEQTFLAELSRLTIRVDQAEAVTVIRDGAAAAARFSLAAYDAAYVALALKEALPLATLDRRMQTAAEQAGVAIFNP